MHCRKPFSLYLTVACSMLAIGAQAGPNIVTNGGFEQPAIPFGSFTIVPSIPGWTLDSASNGSGIEVQNHVAGSPYEGDQFVELSSDGTTQIDQTLSTTPGQTYDLSFAFSARPGVADNTLDVTFGGSTIFSSPNVDGSALGDTDWHVYHFLVTAAGSSTLLTFGDLRNPNDSVGTYIDAVSVTSVPEPVFFQASALLVLGGLGLLRLRRKSAAVPLA